MDTQSIRFTSVIRDPCVPRSILLYPYFPLFLIYISIDGSIDWYSKRNLWIRPWEWRRGQDIVICQKMDKEPEPYGSSSIPSFFFFFFGIKSALLGPCFFFFFLCSTRLDPFLFASSSFSSTPPSQIQICLFISRHFVYFFILYTQLIPL